MERFRLRRHNAPAPLKIRKDSNEEPPQLHSRPLSLIDNEVPKDTLEVLLDAMPSRSLPATPLARKRSDHQQFYPPEPPISINVMSALTATVPVVEVNCSSPLEHPNITVEDYSSHANSNEKHMESGSTDITKEKFVAVSSEVKKVQEAKYIWDEIREILLSSEQSETQCALDNPPIEDLEHASGLEQLRAFLSVCD